MTSYSRARILLTVLAYFGALGVMLLSTIVGNLDRAWMYWLIGALLLQSAITWMRDRLFPKSKNEFNVDAPSPATTVDIRAAKLRNPCWLALAAFLLLALPLFAVLSMSGLQNSRGVDLIAVLIGVWGVTVATAGILLAADPGKGVDRMTEWWLPNAALFVIAFAATKLAPDLVVLMLTGREVGAPDIRLLVLVPVAALVWRSVSMHRNPRRN